MSKEELAKLSASSEMKDLFIRRAVRMIYQTPVHFEDERRFNEWRKSHGLEPLDENNLPVT